MNTPYDKLSPIAWKSRENARIFGETKVGAALVSEENNIYEGCNIEHKFRKSIHAEVAAITNMIVSGDKAFNYLLIVAERERFTPCGECMDWIIEFANSNCKIAFQREPNGKILEFKIDELMPFYPR